MKRLSSESTDVTGEVTKLKDENGNLTTQLQESKKTIIELENEIVQYRDRRYEETHSLSILTSIIVS